MSTCRIDSTQINNVIVAIGRSSLNPEDLLKQLVKTNKDPKLYKAVIEKFSTATFLRPSQKAFLQAYSNPTTLETAIVNYTKSSEDKVLANPIDLEWLNKSPKEIFGLSTDSYKYLQSKFRQSIFQCAYLNNNALNNVAKEAIIRSGKTANNNIYKYLNTLYQTILKYVGEPESNLFEGENFKSYYKTVLLKAASHAQNIDLSKIKTNESKEQLDIINSIIILTKFDELLKQEFGTLIKINAAYDGYLSKKFVDKYILEVDPLKLSIYKDEDQARFISSNTQSNFFKLWISTIPVIDHNGNEVSGQYLTPNAVQIELGILSRLFFKYYKTYGKVLSFTDNAEFTLKEIFNNKIFASAIEKSTTLRSLKYYLYNVLDENGDVKRSIDTYSIEEIMTEYRKNNYKDCEVNLFNILGFEAAKSNSGVLILSEYDEEKEEWSFSTLDISKTENQFLTRDLIINKIATDKVNEQENPLKDYQLEDGTLLSEITSSSDISSILKNKRHVKIYTPLKAFNISKEEVLGFLEEHNDLESIKKLILSINENYRKESSETTIEAMKEDLNLSNDALKFCEKLSSVATAEVKMQTLNGNKDSIPVSRMYSPFFSALEFIDKSKKFYGENGSVFTKYIDLFTNEDNESYKTNVGINIDLAGSMYKTAQSLSPREALEFELRYGFVQNWTKGMFVTQPCDYSDKSTIFNLIINLKAKIGEKSFAELTINEIENLYYQTQKAFYESIETKILSNWSKVFNREGDKKFKTLEEVDTVLSTLTKEELQNKIYQAFEKDNTLEIVIERDYSAYKDGLHINRILLHNINLYKSDTKNSKWKTEQLKNYNSFMKFVSDQNYKFNFAKGDIESILSSDEITLAENETVFDLKHGGVNPFFYKYLLMKNMFMDSWLNISIGQPWIHKSKKKPLNSALLGTLQKVQDINNVTVDEIQKINFPNSLKAEEKEKARQKSKEIFDDYIKLINYAKKHNFKDLEQLIHDYNYDVEDQSRCDASQKRNNSYTATGEKYLTNSAKTIIRDITVAIIDDHLSEVFNLTGSYSNGLESQNGSIYVTGWVAKLMENALPARGQRGVQKNITLHTGLGYSTQVKDAQQIINNELIRLTAYQDRKRKIDYKKILQRMSYPQDFSWFDISSINGKHVMPSQITDYNLYYNYLGQHYKILDITRENGNGYNYSVRVIAVDENGNPLKNQKPIDLHRNIKNAYDLWQTFGGEYSEELVDGVLTFGETSMEAVSDYMDCLKDASGSKILQENQIHMLCHSSAIKMGAVNINRAKDVLYNDSDKHMMYFKMSLSFSGLQNDKNHMVDEDNIKEMSQVISALAAGNETVSIAQQAYDDIAAFTKKQVELFARLYNLNKTNKSDDFYKEITKFILKSFANADHISVGGSIAKMMEKENLFLTSDSQIYNKFVASFISELNNSAIRRKYTGLSGILCPSDGAIQVLEKDGITYLMSDVFREALKNPTVARESLAQKGILEPSNEDLIKEYLNLNFPDVEVTNMSSLKLGDIIKVNEEIIALDNPIILQKYTKYIPALEEKVYKVTSLSRDLKPAEHLWRIGDTQYNIWTCPLVTLNLKLQQSKKKISNTTEGKLLLESNSKLVFQSDFITTDDQSNHFILTEDEAAIYQYLKGAPNISKELSKLLTKYTKVIASGRGIANGTWGLNVSLLDKGLTTSFNQIENYTINEAECIFPDVYFDKLGTKGHTVSEILKQGASFFEQGFEDQFNLDKKGVDLIVNTGDRSFNIIIAKESELSPDRFTKIPKTSSTYTNNNGEVWVLNEKGSRLYQLMPNVSRYYNNETKEEVIVIHPDALAKKEFRQDFFRKFDRILSIVPALNGFKQTSKVYQDILKVCKANSDLLLHKIFKSSIENLQASQSVDQAFKVIESFKVNLKNIYKDYISKLAKERFITFEKIQYLLSSRIPSQSLQSFMAMKNVGFTQNQLNNIYVSRWQIWIQGSDFDIDVAYNMMYSIDKYGRLILASPLANRESEETLRLSKLLPMPNHNILHDLNYTEKDGTIKNAKGLLIDQTKKDLKADREYYITRLVDGTFKVQTSNKYNVPADLVEVKEVNGVLYKVYRTQDSQQTGGLTRTQLIDSLPMLKYPQKTYLNIKSNSVFTDETAAQRAAEHLAGYSGNDISELIYQFSINQDNPEELLKIYIKTLQLIDQYTDVVIDSTYIQYRTRFNPETNTYSNSGITNPALQELIEDFRQTINLHNYTRVDRDYLKNRILDQVRGVSNDITNMQASYMSVDEGMDKIKSIIEELGLEAELGQIHDGTFIFKMQEVNYIGKKTVGIFANALKGYFALKQFFNRFPNNTVRKTIKLPIEDNPGYSFEAKVLAGTIQDDITGETPDISLSAFLSLATDNAKELGLAKINSGMDFAGSYSYLTILGIPLKEQIKFFTSPVIRKVVEYAKGNIFSTESKMSITKAISTIAKELKVERDQENITDEEKAKIQFQLDQLAALTQVYESAQEFRALTAILKINQGLDNKSNELILFKNKFGDQLNKQFGNIIGSSSKLDDVIKKFIDFGITKDECERVIKQAIDVGLLSFNGTELKLNTIDFNGFFLNDNYKKAVIDLYEICKDTFNIYKCIANSASFNAMLTQTALFDDVMQISSVKHRVSSNILQRLKDYKYELPSEAFNGASTLKYITSKQIKNVQDFVEHKMITEWLKKSLLLKKFKFNKADILKLTNKDTSTSDNVNFDLTTAEGIQIFKDVMEQYIIPIILKTNPDFDNNEFVNRLIFYHDKYSKGDWYKLNVNLSSLNTGTSQELSQELTDGYNDLRMKKSPIPSIKGIPEFTWGELLYVYDKIASKNKMGPNRMSAIFEQQVENDLIAKDYLEFESKIEKGEVPFDITDQELLFALYNNKGSLVLSQKTSNQNWLVEQSPDTELSESLTENNNPEQEEETKSNKDSKSKKKIETIKYTLKNTNMNNGFMNLFNIISSKQTNAEVSLEQFKLRKELLNYILNRQLFIELNCN